MVIAPFILSYYQSLQFNISEYGNSAEPIRMALLESAPIGSSLNDVYDFMKEENIPNVTEFSSGGCGYIELKDGIVSLVACTDPLDPFSSMWLIHFIIDENNILENIKIIGYYP